MTASPQIDWPTGGFEWTKDLRAKLPIVRGIRAPEFKPAGCWAEPPVYEPIEPRLESHSRRRSGNLWPGTWRWCWGS
jgi:hypothetical protein